MPSAPQAPVTIVIIIVADGRLQLLGADLTLLGQPVVLRGQTWTLPATS